jgi:hypothetical protein
MMEDALRREGCSSCAVRVSGPESRTVEILDPKATHTDNDYRGRPIFWYNAGFRTVIYFSAPGVVYARHSMEHVARAGARGPVAGGPPPLGASRTWMSTAPIREIRAIYQRIEQQIAAGVTAKAETRRCDEVATAASYRAPSGEIQRLSIYGATEHLVGEAHYYYDSGRLRFSYLAFRADNSTHRQRRVYFSASGTLLHRDDQLLSGPGYAGGPPDDAIVDPEEFLRACGTGG